MSHFNRREFIRMSGLGAATAVAGLPGLAPRSALAATSYNIVVVGGGLAGATCARYLRDWGRAEGLDVAVTLIERNGSYASPILSNLVLVGALASAKLDFGYAQLAAAGVKVIRAEVTAIDPGAKRVFVNKGLDSYPYDRLVIAPGIDFDYVNGLEPPQVIAGLEAAIASGRIVPAWKGGPDVALLRKQLTAMPSRRGTFILSIPKAPYRCPPGPYERACVVADYLRKVKGGGQVIVLDANDDIQAEKHTFETAFAAMGVVYVPKAHLSSVSVSNQLWTVVASTGTYSGNVVNVLPRQRAGKALGLIPGDILNGGRFAPVHALTYQASAPGYEDLCIHVVGDAQATGQPKAGHIGNGEAKVCADAIIRMLKLGMPHASTSEYIAALGVGRLPPVVTNSACYSPIKANSAKTASYLTVGYRAEAPGWTPQKIGASLGEAPAPNGDNYEKMFDWAENLFYDTFGVARRIG